MDMTENSNNQRSWPAAIADPVPAGLIRGEMDSLQDRMLFESGDYRVYLIRSTDAPNAMRELYRLREETFRLVGEGTGRPEDTDIYDTRYYHLILWNITEAEMAGAYRIGDCGSVMDEYGGIKGIYTASLVRYSDEAVPVLSRCMELGRSFIRSKYQREVNTLRLLFAGLTVSSLYMPGARYYMGPVSISNDYPRFYQSLIVRFLTRDFLLPDAERIVSPTHPFVPDGSADFDEMLKDIPAGDIDGFDRMMLSMSDGKYRLPVLVRQYFNCAARLACFNVDPDFTNSLDGLIFLDVKKIPPQKLRSFLRCVPEGLRDKVFGHFLGSSGV
jgi:hypothetical protein